MPRGAILFVAIAAALAAAVLTALGRASAAAVLALLFAAIAGGAVARLSKRQVQPSPEPLPPPPADDLGPGLAAVLDAIDEPALVARNGRVTLANEAARRLLGDHVEGEDLRLAIRSPRAAAALAEDNSRGVEIDDLGAMGQRFELVATRLADGSRLIRLADRSISHATERMRTDFVANASHELRTPLSTLLGFIETLEDAGAAENPATRARFLKIMAGEARRMQQLVDDLMSLSRIEVDRFTAPSSSVALGALATEVAAIITTAQHLEPGRVMVAAGAGDAKVSGDRAQLSQLLHNLIGNAIKYGRAGSPVRVLVKADHDEVRLTVADEGDGIAPEHLPRITERFYRVDAGRSRGLGGTGLGLSIVKHIAERHRARLQIESRVGDGTTVSVRFPRMAG